MSWGLTIGMLLSLLLVATAYADPVPAPGQYAVMYGGAFLALACEVLVVLLSLRRYRYRFVRLGWCLLIVNIVSFTIAFPSGLLDSLTRVITPSWLPVLLIELGIVVFEAAALFYLVRFPFVRSTQSVNTSFMTSLAVSFVGNVTSLVTGWFFMSSLMWLYYWAQGNHPGSYLHYLRSP